MENNIKTMDIKEFRDKGYLQELNRTFLHPLGLALEVVISDDGTEKFGGVWDYRDDKTGIIFDFANSDDERKKRMQDKCYFVENECTKRSPDRKFYHGFMIEPIIY